MSEKSRVVLAGGSGFLGRSLAQLLLREGYEVAVLTRSAGRRSGPTQFAQWDGKTTGDWARLLDGAHALVNLTGKSVNCRYTPEARAEILDSRVDSVRALGEAMAHCSRPPRVFVQSGSLAIYGNPGDRICVEDSPHGSGFSANVCEQWEAAFNALSLPETRKVVLRIGFALKRGEGALRMLEGLTRFFLGGTIGNGQQYISWIHITDLDRMFMTALQRDDLIGPFNATGPAPVTNEQFMRALRKALHRPWSPPVPPRLVRLGARVLGTEGDLALHGFRCFPERFQKAGFNFDFDTLGAALADLYENVP
ncbi:MAG TPA: TIGR01777 family oxidoreductase [Chthoniobacterales bacterium]